MVSSSSFLTYPVNNNPAPAATMRRSCNNIHDLPDEILQEIFSRAPAKYVLRCRSVCRRWKSLTATQYFVELHHRHHRNTVSSSDDDFDFTVLVEEMVRPLPLFHYLNRETYWKGGKKLYMFDAWREGGGEEKKVISPSSDDNYIDAYEDDDDHKSEMYIYGSSSGLVVLYERKDFDMPMARNFIIINPINGDKVKIKVTEDVKIIAQIFGVFFHPVLKEFCVLWGQNRRPLKDPELEIHKCVVEGYKLLNLGPSQSRWRNLENHSTIHLLNKHIQPRIKGSNRRGTVGVTSPIVLDDVLYWMVEERTQLMWANPKSCEEAILGFDTRTEEFHLLPHPAPCACRDFYGYIDDHPASRHLLEDNGYVHNLIYHQETMHLLENSRHLSLIQFSKMNAGLSFDTWIFKKEEIIPHTSVATASYNINKGSWIKTHTVKLNDHEIFLSSQLSHPRFSTFHSTCFRPIAMADEETLLVRLWTLGYLFVCNLKLGTCERFESKRGTDNITPVAGIAGAFMCAHTHTLMPIRNSKSEILLEEL